MVDRLHAPSTAPRPSAPKLRKRVYLVALLLLGLMLYAVTVEGLEGLISFVVGIALLFVLWQIVWHAILKEIPLLVTARNVLFEWKKEEDRPVPKKRITVFE